MAIQRRAVGTVASAGSGAISPGIPAGTLANDILVCVFITGANPTITFPAGWTIKVQQDNGTGHRFIVAWKRAVGGDSAPSISGATQDEIARIVGYSGCIKSGDPFATMFGSQSNASSATVTAPAISVLIPQAMVLFCGGWSTTGGAAPTFSAYSGTLPTFTEAIDNNFTGTVVNVAICEADGIANTTGTTGSRTATADFADINSGALLALIPDGGNKTRSPGLPQQLPRNIPKSFIPITHTQSYAVASAPAGDPILGAAIAGTTAAAQLTGAGALLGAAADTTTAAGVLSGAGALTAASVAGAIAAANLQGTANATGAAVAGVIAAGQITGQGALLGAAVSISIAAAVAGGAGALTGAAVASVTASGVLADFAAGNLLGAAVSGAFAAAGLTGAGALTAASVVSVTAAGNLSASGALSGAAVAGSIVAGQLSALDSGSINACTVSFSIAAGELISLTQATPEVLGSGHPVLRKPDLTPDLRKFKFYDLQRPVEVVDIVSADAVSAFPQDDSVKSSPRQREALALFLLMV